VSEFTQFSFRVSTAAKQAIAEVADNDCGDAQMVQAIGNSLAVFSTIEILNF